MKKSAPYVILAVELMQPVQKKSKKLFKKSKE